VYAAGCATFARIDLALRRIRTLIRFSVDDIRRVRITVRVRARAGMDQHCGAPPEGRSFPGPARQTGRQIVEPIRALFR
jgi:hypothetical protein